MSIDNKAPFEIITKLFKGSAYQYGKEPWEVEYTNNETRYFTIPEKIGSFDGTAQGYGYKSKASLYKAYYYQANKKQIEQNARNNKHFVKEYLAKNPAVKECFDIYFSEDNMLRNLKERYPINYEDFTTSFDTEKIIGLDKATYKKIEKEYTR